MRTLTQFTIALCAAGMAVGAQAQEPEDKAAARDVSLAEIFENLAVLRPRDERAGAESPTPAAPGAVSDRMRSPSIQDRLQSAVKAEIPQELIDIGGRCDARIEIAPDGVVIADSITMSCTNPDLVAPTTRGLAATMFDQLGPDEPQTIRTEPIIIRFMSVDDR